MAAGAFLLAAGFGTRLRPLTQYRPKPLVPVCGVTVLEQALALCRRHGILDVVVNAHHLAEQVQAFCEAFPGMRVHVQVERPEILGTGGGLKAAEGLLAERFAVVNGDVLCDGDLAGLLEDCACSGVEASMLLRRAPDAARHGIVALDAAGRVARLTTLARLEGAGPVAEDTHFTGVHALRRGALARVPPGGFACIVRTAYVQLLPLGAVRGRIHPGTWLDVGAPAAYLEASRAVLEGALPLPLDPWERVGWGLRGEVEVGAQGACDLHPTARFEGPCWIGRGVVVEAGAVVGPYTVVGQGARVGRGAALRDSVVWDGCAVGEGSALMSAVVHDGGVLRVG
ncbi:MAG: sugar phosphate nucleotidyltransferase [Pseudomonadota bacterium]